MRINDRRLPLTTVLASTAMALAGSVLIATPAQAAPPVVVTTILQMKPLMLGNPSCTDVELGQDIIAPGGTLAVACDAAIDLHGHTLTLAHINIGAGKTLTIKATGGGALNATSEAEMVAAIQTTGATLVIEGGDITAEGGTASGAGIGGGGGSDGGTVKIQGGSVTASGGTQGAGIGGGGYGADGGTITISGGTVNATGNDYAAAIGGGHNGTGGTITISGGTVNATGGWAAAGIGGGLDGNGGSITISGGTVDATGANTGAAIGGGSSAGGTINITGGNVTATAGINGAAIGGGYNGDGGTITINTATVTASSNGNGAAIGGGGTTGDGGTITINGGIVTATAGGGGAAIGGSYKGDGGTINIAGGTVIANNNGIGSPGIGGGYFGVLGTLSIGQGADVTARGYRVVGSGEASGSDKATFSVAGTLRVPLNSTLSVPTGDVLTVASTGVIAGVTGEANTGVIRGLGVIENAGSITLPTNRVGGPMPSIKDHQYTVSFDGQGGTDPDDVKVFAKSFTDGERTLPTPTRAGYGFGGWYTETNGGGTKIEATTTLPGTSDGTPVAIDLYAKWSLNAPTLTGDPTATSQVGNEFTYSPTLDASPGTSVTLTSGTLPDGLTLSSTTGAITGTPAAGSGGTYPITLTADNDVDPNATLDVTITINDAPTLAGASSATGETGQPFGYTPTTVGGFPAPSITVSAGTLPAGLSLNATTGKITGTPAAGSGGTYPITLQAYNGIVTIATLDVTITVDQAPTLTGASTATGVAGQAFAYTPTTLGGSPAPTVTLIDSDMPEGLSLDASTGKISGTPLGSGTFPMILKASNGIGTPATLEFTITINRAPTMTGASTATGQEGQPFSYLPSSFFGSPHPTASVSAGALPAGLSLNPSTGAITGTPTETGTFPITLQASNGIGTPPTLDVTITIAKAAITGLAPTITGTVREGQLLTAHEGPVVPNNADLAYQWNRYGTPIPGATSQTYKPVKADAGRKLSVTITATSHGKTPQTLTSPLTGFVSSPYARLVLSSTVIKKGQSFNIIATGLKPKQTYIIWLSGKRSYIGFADVSGTVVRTVKFPTSTKPGTRRVRVSGYTNGKRTYTIYTPVKYTA